MSKGNGDGMVYTVDQIIPSEDCFCIVSRSELKHHRHVLTPQAIKQAEEFYKGWN